MSSNTLESFKKVAQQTFNCLAGVNCSGEETSSSSIAVGLYKCYALDMQERDRANRANDPRAKLMPPDYYAYCYVIP